MAVFIARPDVAIDSVVTPLFLEVSRGYLNLRVWSGLHDVSRGDGRVTSQEPDHFSDRFVLRGPGGVEASSIQTSGSGGPFQDHFDIVFEWPGSTSGDGPWVLEYGGLRSRFSAHGLSDG
ncbi:hypothetical protein GCM10009627_15490 [Curtobacterium herbarum]|uniref:Uncharacterized protein n=1 Tax=Curtobacterium herbarum TaxID=150122 RepID=A0ABP4K6T6_9MICO|nr:hypothetical protein [Curtobacterium herbarum]